MPYRPYTNRLNARRAKMRADLVSRSDPHKVARKWRKKLPELRAPRTQKELAAAVGVSQPYISNVEDARKRESKDYIDSVTLFCVLMEYTREQ